MRQIRGLSRKVCIELGKRREDMQSFPFLVALELLTIIPVKLKKTASNDDVTKSMTYFPVVGLLLGAILVLVNLVVSPLFPPLAAKALVLITLVIATGASHLNGFADTCNGFFTGKSRSEILATMQESRLYSVGIVSLVSLLLVKFALLYGLVERVELKALLLMPVIGRWAMVVMGTITSYAQEKGEERFYLAGKANYEALLRTSAIAFIICLLLLGFLVIPLMFVVYLSILALRWFSLRKIGGITNDVLGATTELMEVVTLLVICLMIR